MWPDWEPNLGPLALESDLLPTALHGPTDCLGRVKLILQQNFIGLVYLSVVVIKRGNPVLYLNKYGKTHTSSAFSHESLSSNTELLKPLFSDPLADNHLLANTPILKSNLSLLAPFVQVKGSQIILNMNLCASSVSNTA